MNHVRLNFLFDTGACKTLLDSKIWYKVNHKKKSLKRVNVEVLTCNGKRVWVKGIGSCSLNSFGLNQEIEVLVVCGLSHECLLGLDVAEKIKGVDEKLSEIRDLFKKYAVTESIESNHYIDEPCNLKAEQSVTGQIGREVKLEKQLENSNYFEKSEKNRKKD